MKRILWGLAGLLLLVASPLELSARHVVKHRHAQAQTAGCAVGATPPSTGCGISDMAVGGALSATDAIAICQQGAGGCPASSPTWKLTQVPLLPRIQAAFPHLSDTAIYSRLNYMTAPGSAPAPTAGTIFQLLGPDTTNSRESLVSFGGTSKYDVTCFGGTGAAPTAVAPGTSCGGFDAFWYNGSGAPILGAGLRFDTVTGGGMTATITSSPNTAGPVDRVKIFGDGGVTIGAPTGGTGGDMGVGTVNASGGFYINGAAVGGGGGGGLSGMTAGQVPIAATATTVTSSKPLSNAAAATIATASGTLTNGHCVSINGTGDFVDAGGACTTGGGGGTVSSSTSGNVALYTGTSPSTTVGGVAMSGDATIAPTGATTIAANAVTNAKAAQAGANTVKGNFTATTANEADNAVPSCSAANQALNYTSGTGLGCATISGGGGTPNVFTGTYGGTTTTAWTVATPNPSTPSTNTAGNLICGNVSANASNVAPATLNVGTAGALPTKKWNITGLVNLNAGDITTQVQNLCFQLDAGAGNWVLQGANPLIRVNAGTYPITVADCQNGTIFRNDSGTNALTLPASASLAGGSCGLWIQSLGNVVTLAPNGTDTINGLNATYTFRSDTLTQVTLNGTAWIAPVEGFKAVPLTFGEGQNLTTNPRLMRMTLATPVVIYAVECAITVAAGVADNLQLAYSASAAFSTPTNIGSPCNANTTGFQSGLLTAPVVVPINSVIGFTASASSTAAVGMIQFRE